MTVILLRIPGKEPRTDKRPERCPYCGSQLLQRWGQVTKPITAHQMKTAILYRYRCKECERTFRNYPVGIDRSSFAQDIRRLAAVLWALGLSYREIVGLFKRFEITLSRSTIWREGQEFNSQLNMQKIPHHEERFVIDQAYIHEVSSKLGIVVAIDFGLGAPSILGTLDEYNPNMVLSWLEPLVIGTKIEILVYHNEDYNNLFNDSGK